MPPATDIVADAPSPLGAARRSPVRGMARDLPDGLRIGFMTVVLVAIWNHVWFVDLGNRESVGAAEGGSLLVQILFLTLAFAMVLIVRHLGMARLRPLASWPLLSFGIWLGASAFLSVDPLLSIRRMALYAITALLAAGLLVVARSGRQFAAALALAAGAILLSCYLGIAMVPSLTVHSAYDITDGFNHTGLWRGIFGHKNEAGVAMTMIAVCGLYIAAVKDRFAGWCIVLAATVFLVGSGSKTAIAVLPLVLVLTTLCRLFRSGVMRGLILLGPLALMLLATIGSVLIPSIRRVLDTVLPDATYTARNEIWTFAISNILERPVRGWGYGAFWLSDRTRYGSVTDSDWVQTATQAHNSYLEAALIMGLPGLTLTVLALVIAPIRDLQRGTGRGDLDPASLLFLRLWLLALISASFESVLFNANTALCGMALLGVFGLRMRAERRVIA